jgi:hypothetical protein
MIVPSTHEVHVTTLLVFIKLCIYFTIIPQNISERRNVRLAYLLHTLENTCLDSGCPQDFPGLPQFPRQIQKRCLKQTIITFFHVLSNLSSQFYFFLSNMVTCAV